MIEYFTAFNGREEGAIGVIDLQNVIVQVDNPGKPLPDNDIRIALYEGKTRTGKAYEHITNLTYTEL